MNSSEPFGKPDLLKKVRERYPIRVVFTSQKGFNLICVFLEVCNLEAPKARSLPALYWPETELHDSSSLRFF